MIKTKHLYLVIMGMIFLFTQCKKDISESIESEIVKSRVDIVKGKRAIYYWKTLMQFDEADKQMADNLNLATMYIRYFDISWSYTRGGIPVGVLNVDKYDFDEASATFGTRNIIPTVFITNEVFKNIKEGELKLLAYKTSLKIEQISAELENLYYETNKGKAGDNNKQYAFDDLIVEVQIDCDWTASTKDKYFMFLEILDKEMEEPLSCTVRLHQYRDRKLMGIPPLDRGLLMCYNVADVQRYDTKNAIIDANIVQQYVIDDPYPIRLDVGLPMFSWAAWYRGQEFKGLVSGWNNKDAANKNLYKKSIDNQYIVSKDAELGNYYLREGDVLRWDNSNKAEIEKTIAILNDKIDLSASRIAFFDWETEKIKQHENELETYYSSFE